jgi:diamine N-acetyltransferase
MVEGDDRVTLREITAETVRVVANLTVAEHQRRFVASNAMSLAQALFAPEAWYRAIYLADEPVGFVMLSDQTLLDPVPERPEVWVWRFMVDAKHQHLGVGRAAMRQVIEHVRTKRVVDALFLSFVPEDGGPEAFYRSFGFRPTGAIDDGEVVMVLDLKGDATRRPVAVDVAIPILPCRSVAATVAFYGRLGFEGGTHETDARYAILRRGPLELHFFVFEDLVPADSYAGCYLRVADVEGVHRAFAEAELPSAGIPRMDALEDRQWGMREFAVVDPDGNLLRIGQDVAQEQR